MTMDKLTVLDVGHESTAYLQAQCIIEKQQKENEKLLEDKKSLENKLKFYEEIIAIKNKKINELEDEADELDDHLTFAENLIDELKIELKK